MCRETLCQLGLSAGFGPQFKKQDTEDLYHDDNEVLTLKVSRI